MEPIPALNQMSPILLSQQLALMLNSLMLLLVVFVAVVVVADLLRNGKKNAHLNALVSAHDELLVVVFAHLNASVGLA